MVACKFCDCEVKNELKCSQCKSVFYCNIECQKRNWHLHKLECNELSKQRNIPSDIKASVFEMIDEYKRFVIAVSFDNENKLIQKDELSAILQTNDFLKQVPPCSRIAISNATPIVFCCVKNCLFNHSSSNDFLFMIAMKQLMKKEIWTVFAYDYDQIARGNACQKGFGYSLSSHTKIILTWYYGESKEKMDQLLKTAIENKINNPYFSLWQEFHEMFILNDDAEIHKKLLNWAIGQDCGVLAFHGGLVHTSNLYNAFVEISHVS